ncbi:MAG: carboxypeptidase regulatory-like domain-containing protein [Acidobacteria bacterium]|nr:carboxypeptidase regulatory-like domain-containing protein [Acidobacteriota bacterium]
MSVKKSAALHVVLLLAATVPLIQAQSTYGVILGNVSDASGAAVKGAKVKVTQTAANTNREGVTNDEGAYEFQNVDAGPYVVSVTAPGFRTFVSSGVTLDARTRLRVDARLEVGEVSQTVEVTTTAGVIATDSPTIQSSLTAEKVLNLPSNVRGAGSTSPYALLQSLPGVQADNGLGLSIQGGLPAQSESTVDGISITASTGNSPNRNMFLSVESISEVRVQGVGNTAEFGQPGDVTVISKGGGNDYHGALFWYHQNKALDARSYGQNVLPAKIGNTFGGTVGGPLTLPKIYDGKNRTFFYFTWESMRFPRQGTVQNTVPTSFVKNGDFSREGVNIRDPFTGVPFAGNIIPASRISDIAKKVMTFYPEPNTGPTDRRSASNFRENRSTSINSDQYEARVDQSFNTKHTVYGRFSYKNNPSSGSNNLTLPSDTLSAKFWQVSGSWTYAVRPNLLNEARVGFVKSDTATIFNFDGRNFTNGLGLKDIQKDIFFNGLPNFGIDLYTGVSKGRPGYSTSDNVQFIDNLTWVRGKHTLKFGGDVRNLRARSDLGFTTGNNYGDFSFGPAFSGYGFSDFLLGVPAQSAIAVVSRDNDGQATHYKMYVQDTIRVSQKLTLDLGLRYELHPGYRDNGLNIANFDRNVARTGRVIIMSDPEARNLVAPGAILSFNGCPGAAVNGVACTPIVTAKDAGLPEALRTTYKTQFLPRIGTAYRLNNKTTLRASAGLYNMILMGSVFYSLTGTVQSDVRNFNNIGADGKPIFQLPDTRTPGSGVRGGSLGTFEFRTANQIDFKPPQMFQWALSIDRELSSTTGLRLSYIGNRSYQLPWAPDVNQMQPSNTFYSQRTSLDRPFPNWGLIFSRDAGANSIYNSLQMELNRRFAKGLSFTTAFTLAKNLADNAGPTPTGFAGETGGGRVTNSLDRRSDRGDVYATRRHRFVNTFVYELPFGKGRKFLGDAGRAADLVLGGWQLSSILTLQSGPFLTPNFSGGDPSGTNAASRGGQRPDRIGEANGSTSNPTRDQWADRSAFLCPGRAPGSLQFDCRVGSTPGRDPNPIGRFGNAGVGILNGPGTFGLNMGLSKRFIIREGVGLRLEGSFTNLPNWTNLGDPNLNIADNNFGRITGSRGVDFGGGRTGQVALRLEF